MADTILIIPRDPLIFRDSRPFDSSFSTRIHVHTWPFPSVTAGALRTYAGKRKTWGFSNKEKEKDVRHIDIRGPLLYRKNSSSPTLYVPAPRDAVVVERDGKEELLQLSPQPLKSGKGTDLPFAMQPLVLPESEYTPKNGSKYAWWPLSLVKKWLCDANTVVAAALKEEKCLEELPLDERTHVAINPATGAAVPEQLFSTRGIDFMQGKTCADGDMPFQLALRVDRTNGIDFSGAIPLGAERRLAELSVLPPNEAKKDLWNCPDEIKAFLKRANLKRAKYIRLQLATPAIFNGYQSEENGTGYTISGSGWYPDWLAPETENEPLVGTIPKTSIKVKLIAAAVDRFVPISGYAYGRKPGIKSTKKMVPAGSVYFFEVLRGETEELTQLWLHPICGQSYYDPRTKQPNSSLGADGFGLALWGVWQPKDNEG